MTAIPGKTMTRRRLVKTALDIATWLVLLVALLPAVWVVLTSVRPNVEINAVPPVWIPREFTLDAFSSMFGGQFAARSVPVTRYMRNSLIVATSATLVSVSLGTLAGYAFSQFEFRGRTTAFLGLMLSRTVPGIALGLPLFVLFANLGWVDKVHALALTYVVVNIPFAAWLMDGFFREVPRELAESAKIDGATAWQALWRVILPLTRPGLAAASIFAFLAAWNEYQLAVVITRTINSKTFPVGLFDFTAQFTTDWRGMCAMSVVMMVPAIIFVLGVQRQLMRGLTFGATKG